MENYIKDTLELLINEALVLRESAKDEFEIGQLFGLHQAITILLNQTEAFGVSDNLPPNIRDFNPEKLLSDI